MEIRKNLTVSDWCLKFSPGSLAESLQGVPAGEYDVTIKTKQKIRSLQKLRYFHWPVLLHIALETWMVHEGSPKDEIEKAKKVMKEALKIKYRQFFPVTWTKDPFRKGKRITDRKGMSEISDEDCGKFLKALSIDWNIPEPDTGEALAFYEEMMRRFP